METKSVLFSEQSISQQTRTRHFPAPNCLISRLSQALLVIEAAGKSGGLIKARFALDKGREVFPVPCHAFDARASGCNSLIGDESILVRSAEGILIALGEEWRIEESYLFKHIALQKELRLRRCPSYRNFARFG